METGREVRLLEQGQAAPHPLDRRDHLGARRAAGQVGRDAGPLAAVAVAGLEGGQLLVVGVVGALGHAAVTPAARGRVSTFGRWGSGVGSRGVDHSEWGAGGGWFGGVAEAVGEGGAATEDAALHGADRDLQDLGGVGVGDPVQVAEDDRDPELLGDLGERGLDGDGRGDHLAELAAGGDGQAGVLRVEGGQAGPAPAPGLVGGRVHGDPVQPGREGGRLAEAGGLAQGGQEGLLGGVLGVLPAAEDPQAESVDAALVARDQLAEGPGVAAQVGGEQGLVARVAHDRRTASATPMR